MRRRAVVVIFVLALAVGLGLATLPDVVRPVLAAPLHQTWPSRTPTPSGGQPTNTPPPAATNPPGGGGGDGTPSPASTGEGDPGVTPSGSATFVLATPIGGYLPTANACDLEPTAQALGRANVRTGPGLDYEVIGTLVYLEVRPIIGRAAAAPWWLIDLVDGSHGWVADIAVVVQGYTGLVPLADPPLLDGQTPTPGAPWNPTPNPVCTIEPTHTPSATSRASSTPRSPEPTVTAAATLTPTPLPSNTPTLRPSATSPPEDPTATLTAAPLPTAEPLDDDPGDGAAGALILVVGLGLIVAGAVTFVVRQRGA